MTDSARFWGRVDRSGECWLWTGAINWRRRGYGIFRAGDGKILYAHRFAWSDAVGPIPDGLCVLHRCDNPPCVRPDHLFTGTRLDNNRDMTAKGRRNDAKGERASCAVLTWPEVREIRFWISLGYSDWKLARTYHVGHTTIESIRLVRTWKEPGAVISYRRARHAAPRGGT